MLQLTNKNVLVVEDDEMSARYLIELLNDAGANVIHVDTATDAIFAANGIQGQEGRRIDILPVHNSSLLIIFNSFCIYKIDLRENDQTAFINCSIYFGWDKNLWSVF